MTQKNKIDKNVKNNIDVKAKNSLIGIDITQNDLTKLKGINKDLDDYIESIIKYWDSDDTRIGTIWFDKTKSDSLVELRFVGRIKNKFLK